MGIAIRPLRNPALQNPILSSSATPRSARYGWCSSLSVNVRGLYMATCPFCRRSALRIIVAMTQESVLTRLLRHLKLASVPPPIAPARVRQATFDWIAYAHDIARGFRGDVR